MIIEIECGDTDVVAQYAELAASYETIADELSVVVVNADGSNTPGLKYIRHRTVELDEVQPEHDVVVVYAADSARLVRELFDRLGAGMPRVLVVAPEVDSDDIRRALAQGATSYLIEGHHISCLVEAVAKTSVGLSCLDPLAASVLTQQGPYPADPSARLARAAGGDGTLITPLTARETEIMELIAVGYTVAEVAARLLISSRTVRNNLANIFAKLQVRRQSEAVLLWLGYRPQRGRASDAPAATARSRQRSSA